MRSLVVVVALLAWAVLASCGGPPDEATTMGTRRVRDDSASKPKAEQTAEYEDENSVGMEDRRVSRWRWKGTRKDCFFVVGNRCFETRAQACKAAGCKRSSDCRADESAPVQISCR